MKKLIVEALLVSIPFFGQTKGNKKIETRTFSVVKLEEIKINLYAKIIIDYAAKEKMTITTDTNLLDKIDTKVIDGKLHLNQLSWIQPSRNIIIKIGATNLKRVEKEAHKTLTIVNVDSDSLNIMAHVGKVFISGKVNQLN
jgi:hypothetical protein